MQFSISIHGNSATIGISHLRQVTHLSIPNFSNNKFVCKHVICQFSEQISIKLQLKKDKELVFSANIAIQVLIG